MDVLSHEDELVENLSALWLVMASAIWLIYAAIQIKNRSWMNLSVGLVMALVFFVIGAEEISWGQRIFNIESSEFFLENNSQKEMNFHNLNTNLSEMIYYTTACLVLVAMSVFRNQLSKFLSFFKLDSLQKFLPSQWLIIPPAVMFTSVVGRATIGYRPVFMATIFSAVAVLYIIYNTIQNREYKKTIVYTITTIASTYVTFVFSSIWLNRESNGTRAWMYSEYLEFYIALGLLVYTVDFMLRQSKLEKHTH